MSGKCLLPALSILAAVSVACSAAHPVPPISSSATSRVSDRAGAPPSGQPPDIDRRYIAVAALGMQPLSKRSVVLVTSYGAKGDGKTDDTAAIQRAFDRAPTGDILMFPAGTYRHSNVLVLRATDVVVEGRGATLQASSPQNESIVVAGSKSALLNMAIEGTGAKRLTTPASTDIEVTGRYVQLVGNHISQGSSAGIFMYGATDYRVTGNTVSNTLADGIHSTHDSHRGLVEGNTVFQSGDDTIAVVSYTSERPSGDILINDNHVSGNRNGRGITCVGCTQVTIANNTISDVACCAGVLIANEIETIGVNGVLVENNDIDTIEKTKPTGGSYTSQGGIDINSVSTYAIQYVSLERNTVSNAAFDGIRILEYGSGPAGIDHININGNTIADVGDVPIEFIADPGTPTATTCWNNTYGGKAYVVPSSACTAQALTSAAWPQFNFVTPEGTMWAPDGRPENRPWS
jgi:parallel beta-helix repeat protein